MDNYTDYVMHRDQLVTPVNTPAKIYSGYRTPLRTKPKKRTHSERESPSSIVPDRVSKMATPDPEATPMELTQEEKDVMASKNTPGWGYDLANNMFKRLGSMEKNLLKSMDSRLEAKLDNFAEAVEDQIEEIDSKVSNLSIDMKLTRIQIRKERNRVNSLEVKVNRRNIMFAGFPEKKGETRADCEQLVRDQIAKISDDKFPDLKDCRFESVYREGRFSKFQRRPRDIKVCFIDIDERAAVYRGRFSFDQGIFANHELPEELSHYERQLRPVLKLCKGTKYEEKGRAYIVKGALIVDGKSYTLRTLFDLPDEIQFWANNVRSNRRVFAWHGILCPFSNFFWCVIIIDGDEYDFAEKYICNEKALLFGDKVTSRAILAANDPYECRKLAFKIKGFNQAKWDKKAPEVADKVIRAKVSQNVEIKKFLKNTHPLKLAEAAKDSYWGCGIDLKDDNILRYSKWKRIGHAGEVYMKIRDELLGLSAPAPLTSSSESEQEDDGEDDEPASTVNDNVNVLQAAAAAPTPATEGGEMDAQDTE